MNRRYYPCAICNKPIDFKTAKGEELMWEFEGEGVAHSSCAVLLSVEESEKWETTADVMMACDIDDELMKKINRYREKHAGQG